jgi:hypothetical protein
MVQTVFQDQVEQMSGFLCRRKFFSMKALEWIEVNFRV